MVLLLQVIASLLLSQIFKKSTELGTHTHTHTHTHTSEDFQFLPSIIQKCLAGGGRAEAKAEFRLSWSLTPVYGLLWGWGQGTARTLPVASAKVNRIPWDGFAHRWRG